ncbi:FAD-dependent tricarballylate dehydrogenase TcuA [Phyllobacterium endophyticum]|uniref:Tricarballylate dehydrogenase n=1 Tax=Phyllobacterium endophyticum TaxID=1149773 RepID=A0A2P7AK85_9HYPH|nr:FAD-dependent tricarballylate dehydrogenase TcuA [Phyllobacterium endophyticum]MBB3237160.1 tricarballylate dehydrogenase [Phyllobacterium endophyticum]PSH54619.1 tricarballylate dehydrogenase [Phyllobacterium endophyticum]TYR40613.1 FAD-binding dehydrogenase [Phyllobacterium endophyticum]
MKQLMKKSHFDVVVVGGGNAALCAALSAREQGVSVLLLERAPKAERGGNSSYTEGLMRFAYEGSDDIRALSPDLTPAEMDSDFGSYTEDLFFDDMARVTHNRTDPDLCEILVRQSNETMHWMVKQGVKFYPQFGRQSFKVDGRFKFWGGATLAAWGGGQGLVDSLYLAAEKKGIEIRYNAWVRDLISSDAGVEGVVVKFDGVTEEVAAKSVVLACGGFEANSEWRSKYLGPGWDLAKVRGSKFNTGDGLEMALKIGVQPKGNWSGCHAVGWERYAEDFGDQAVTGDYERDSYPWSIMVNATGKRFLDEGADIRNYTYAKYGRVILEQPGQFAWQVFDSTVVHLLRPEYSTRRVTRVTGNTLEELADKMDDVNRDEFLKTVREFNAAVTRDVPFDPTVKDGRKTEGLPLPKSNWANPIEVAPFEAYAVTCGITFTFGGLRISTDAQAIDTNQSPIPGLYVAGELVGGLFYFNYPGATGLMSGAVFGRIAGRSAAEAARVQASSNIHTAASAEA